MVSGPIDFLKTLANGVINMIIGSTVASIAPIPTPPLSMKNEKLPNDAATKPKEEKSEPSIKRADQRSKGKSR